MHVGCTPFLMYIHGCRFIYGLFWIDVWDTRLCTEMTLFCVPVSLLSELSWGEWVGWISNKSLGISVEMKFEIIAKRAKLLTG